jgi:hypothetical protein
MEIESSLSLPANIQVAIRIRPLLENEKVNGHTTSLIENEGDKEIT